MVDPVRFRRALMGVCVFAFVALSIAVEAGWLFSIDQGVESYTTHHITRSGTAVMSLITEFGSAAVTVGITALMAALFTLQHCGAWARRLLITVAGAMLSNQILKVVLYSVWLHSPHPPSRLAGGFPSGHALCATVLYGFVTVFISSKFRSKVLRVLILAACATIVLMISISRIYLSAHYLSDVIGGVVEGIVWLCAVGIAVDMKRASEAEMLSVNHSRR